jgi:hypothetical protein
VRNEKKGAALTMEEQQRWPRGCRLRLSTRPACRARPKRGETGQRLRSTRERRCLMQQTRAARVVVLRERWHAHERLPSSRRAVLPLSMLRGQPAAKS